LAKGKFARICQASASDTMALLVSRLFLFLFLLESKCRWPLRRRVIFPEAVMWKRLATDFLVLLFAFFCIMGTIGRVKLSYVYKRANYFFVFRLVILKKLKKFLGMV